MFWDLKNLSGWRETACPGTNQFLELARANWDHVFDAQTNQPRALSPLSGQCTLDARCRATRDYHKSLQHLEMIPSSQS